MSHLDVPGGRLYYEVDGEGPPLTLIHAGVAHLRMWDEQVADLSTDYRVIRYDARGFGRTTTDDVSYSNRDDLHRLLDDLDVRKTALLGASRGGSIALDFTLEQPDRLSALILVAGGIGGYEVDEPELADVWEEAERLEEARDWEALVELETRVWTDGPGQPPERVGSRLRQRMIEWNLENYRADQPGFKAQPLSPPAAGRLAEIGVPTLVCWGDLDTSGVIAAGERLSAEIRGARRHVFPGVAHMVSLEQPAEFNRLIRDFLAVAGAG